MPGGGGGSWSGSLFLWHGDAAARSGPSSLSRMGILIKVELSVARAVSLASPSLAAILDLGFLLKPRICGSLRLSLE
jgi:hypothetical protein